jgi:glucose-6-phosphate isomerase
VSDAFAGYQAEVSKYHRQMIDKTGLGNDFLGWYTLPFDYDKAEFELVKQLAKNIREKAEVFIVCGIGGSYLGSRAAIEMVQGIFPKRDVEVYFVGNTFSSTYILQLMEKVKDKSVYVNVISKSGTTTETAIAFRLFEQFLVEKYGVEGSRERIIATTDKAKGTLKNLATLKGYQTLTIPDDVVGR